MTSVTAVGASGRDRAAEGRRWRYVDRAVDPAAEANAQAVSLGTLEANLLAAIGRTIEKTPRVMAVGFDGREPSYGEFCPSNLAEYEHPREVEFVEELLHTTTGKIQKFESGGERVGSIARP